MPSASSWHLAAVLPPHALEHISALFVRLGYPPSLEFFLYSHSLGNTDVYVCSGYPLVCISYGYWNPTACAKSGCTHCSHKTPAMVLPERRIKSCCVLFPISIAVSNETTLPST